MNISDNPLITDSELRRLAGGVTPMIEVVPPLRPGATVGAAVALTHPSCKVQMVPRSFQAGAQRAGGLIEGVSFQIMQTLR